METNMSILDSALRFFAAVIIAGICGAFGSILGVIALYPFITGMTSYDPIYDRMGISTRTEDPHKSDSISQPHPGFSASQDSYRKSA